METVYIHQQPQNSEFHAETWLQEHQDGSRTNDDANDDYNRLFTLDLMDLGNKAWALQLSILGRLRSWCALLAR